MKCPVCQTELRITDRQGVEIDYCPQCRGVWLDRGELDKIIERSGNEFRDRDEHEHREPHRPSSGHTEYGHDPKYKKKKKSMIEELFDF